MNALPWPRTASSAGIYALLALAAVLYLLPLAWIFSTSFKEPVEVFAVPPTLLPARPSLENYGTALGAGTFNRYVWNSLVAAAGSTALGLLIGIPAAFGFARYRYMGSGLLLGFVVVTRIFPPIALALPFFLQFRTLGLIDSHLGLIVAYLPIVLPLVIWVLEGFFRDYPVEILEAASLDGLGVLGTLARIVVPTSWPAISVAALFGFLVAWNDFVIALTLTRTPAAQTMPIGVATLVTQFQTYWGQMTAVAALYLVPVLLVTVLAQRGIVRGLMSGATKG